MTKYRVKPKGTLSTRRTARDEEEKFKLLFQKSAEPILLIEDGRFVDCNHAAVDFLGCPNKDCIIGLQPFDMSPERQPDGRLSAEKAREMTEKTLNEGSNLFEWLRHDFNGNEVWIEVTHKIIPIHGKSIIRAVWRDIGERKKTESLLRESEERFKIATEALQRSRLQLSEAMDLANIVNWERDPATEEFIFNDPFYTFYATTAEREGGYRMGGEEYVKRFVHPEDIPRFYRSVEKRNSHADREFVSDVQHRIIRRDGEVRYVLARIRALKDEHGKILRCYGANQDITAAKQMEERQRSLELQLRESQKMEAIGTLAGGIAHDFNNMLAVIIGNAELALEDENLDDIRANMTQILNASKRSRDLIKQILMFSRKSEGQRVAMRLTPLVNDTANLLRGSLLTTIAIKVRIHAKSDVVMGNPSQLQQVLMNLSTNAAHAMAESGGTLTIQLSETAFNETDRMPDQAMTPGKYVKLTVKDTGAGMSADTKARIFEPFFTTKEPGKGTGMGLAVVFGIVRAHNGAITVQSVPGQGSVFNVFIPSLSENMVKEETPTTDYRQSGNERLLIIDDEPSVVQVVSETLKRIGYRVTTAQGGREGLRKFMQNPNGFDLVITDQVMPRITGVRLAERMLKTKPDLPIILSTGYSQSLTKDDADAIGISELLTKPIEVDALAGAVRRALERRKRTSAPSMG